MSISKGSRVRLIETSPGFPLILDQVYEVAAYGKDGNRFCDGDGSVNNPEPALRIVGSCGCYRASRFEEV